MLKLKLAGTALLCAFAFAFSGASERVAGDVVFSDNDIELVNVEKKKNNFGVWEYSLKDTTYAPVMLDGTGDLVLSFNKDKMTFDDTGRYPVRFSSFTHTKGNGAYGNGAAYFFRSGDRVDVSTRSGVWLSNSEDLGSFSIEFRFNAGSLRDGSIFFSRIGIFSGTKNGIEIKLEKGRIVSYLYNIFTDEEGSRRSVVLSKSPQIRENKWNHFLLSYDRISGKVSQIINETEYDVEFATQSGDSGVGVWVPSFAKGDMPLARIGKNYAGMIDEFRISFLPYEELAAGSDMASRKFREVRRIGRLPVNREGIVSSGVNTFPSSGTMIKLFKWDEKNEPGSAIRFEMRMSDSYFERDDADLKWYRIDNNQRNIYLTKTSDGFLRGKYYQWRAHLVGSPEGDSTPVLKTVKLEYELDTAPNAPVFLEAVEAGDEFVILRWKKNVDFDIEGYNIYYGIKRGEYEGVIRYADGRRINNIAGSDYVAVRIDNNMIEENKERYVRGMLDYPRIKNNVLYYFTVTAYDSYKPDTQFNHESKKAAEVSARPVAASEIGR